MKNFKLLQLDLLSDYISIMFQDDFCEDVEGAECPLYKKAIGSIDGVECLYVCDYLFQLKEKFINA